MRILSLPRGMTAKARSMEPPTAAEELEDCAVAGTSPRAGSGGKMPCVMDGGAPLQLPSVLIPAMRVPLLSEGRILLLCVVAAPILSDGWKPTRGSCKNEPMGSLSCGAPALPCGKECCTDLGVDGLPPAMFRFDAGGELRLVGHHDELLPSIAAPLLPEGRFAGPYKFVV